LYVLLYGRLSNGPVQLEVRESASNGKSGDATHTNGNEPAPAERPVVVERES
jgi:hypothetical protein